MIIFLYIAAAVLGYFAAGFNPAITVSKSVYHKDIRECGSGNAGFTNFKRTFGNKWAWWVLAADLLKGAAVIGLFSFLFGVFGADRQLGAMWTGIFAVLGHAYPAMYGFKGGKGFLVSLSLMWITDPLVGLAATAIMVVLLLTTKYMSLSTVAAMCLCPLLLALRHSSVAVVCMSSAVVLFVAWRHKENFKRLVHGSESKFYLKSKR